jgi:hypothetical protein
MDSPLPPNPRRQAAGRENRKKRGPLTEAGREQLRAAALRLKPWTQATGPRTEAGKKKSAANGRYRQHNALSTREVRAEMADVRQLIQEMRKLRESAEPAGPAAGTN